MELGAIFVGLAMLVASVPYLARPFQEKQFKSKQQPAVCLTPDEERQAVLSALRDLDFDFSTGKVSEEDYSALRAQLVTEAATYIRSEKSIADEQIEIMIQARKASQSNIRKCSNCGNTVEPNSRFCSQCGTAAGNICPSCAKPIQDGDRFCNTCGTKLEVQIEPVA